MAILPVISLALNAAVIDLFTSAADFVLEGYSLGRLATIAYYLCLPANVRLDGRRSLFLQLFEPRKWCVVQPRVQVLDFVSFYLFVWALFGTKLIDKVVLFLFLEHIEATFQVLFDQFCRHSCLLFQLLILVFLGVITQLAEGPQTGVT